MAERLPGPDRLSDEELLARARGGDGAALDELLTRVEPIIYRFGQRLCDHPDDALGVLQETMLTLVRSLHDFRGESALSTWLYAVARSHCSKRRRKQRHAPPMISLEEDAGVEQIASDVPDPAASLEQRQISAALDAALRELDEKYRDVVVLRDVEGLSAAEVAAVLGLSVPAVKSRLHRARALLREDLARRLGEPEAGPPGASCPEVVELVSRRLEGELTADVCAEVEHHVDGCPRCQIECDALRRTLVWCRSCPMPQVPADIQRSVRAAARQVLARRS
jgi:RNA polymerase sigma-70 factor (ECF subfamily)